MRSFCYIYHTHHTMKHGDRRFRKLPDNPPMPDSEKRHTILVVDDSAVMRTLLHHVLSKLGYAAMRADNGSQALDIIRNHHIDLILLDLNMPEMSGIELLSILKEEDIVTPVIMISGSGDIKQAVECLKMGAYEYLLKPVDGTRLEITLKNALSESTLKQQVKLLSTAVTHNPLSIVITDSDGIIEYVNPAFTQCTGYSESEAIGQNASILKSGTHDEAFYKDLWETISSGKIWHGEFLNKKKNGDLFRESTMISPVSLKSSGISHHIAVKQDITEHKITEEALLASRKRFSELMELLPQPLFETNIRGRITYANRAAFQTFLYEPEDFDRGLHYSQLIIPDDLARLRKNLRKITSGSAFNDDEYTALRKNGTTFPILIYSSPIVNNGKPVGVRGIILDITHRKKIEEHLLQSKQQYRNLFQAIPDAVIVIDNDSGKLIRWNKQAKIIFDAESETLASMHLTDLFHEESKAGALQNFASLTPGKTISFESKIVTAFGLTVDVSVSAGVFSTNHNKSLVGIVRDITEQKKSEELIRENIRLKNDFVSNVSHELRTPLFSILGFSSTLIKERQELDNDTIDEFLGIIHEESRRLSDLIEDVLTISRIDSGKISYKQKQINPAHALEEVCRTLTIRAKEKKIRLFLDLPEEPSFILADADAIKQVIINLVGNALKFTPSEGSIRVSMRSNNDSVTIDVSDTGQGIPEKDQEHIFEKFYRVDRPGQEIEGTGLGLSIVKEIVEHHGGTVAVQSHANKGSKFSVTLPATQWEPYDT